MDEKFSIFTLFPSEQIVAGEEYGSYLSIMLIVAVILYGAGVRRFLHKDLAL